MSMQATQLAGAYPIKGEGFDSADFIFPTTFRSAGQTKDAFPCSDSHSHSHTSSTSSNGSINTTKTHSPPSKKHTATKQSRNERNRQNVANFRARQRITAQLQEEVMLLKKSKQHLEQERILLNHHVFELQSALYNIKYSIFTDEFIHRIA